MKLDLDELGRKVRESADECEELPLSHRQALALITRIRELEDALRMQCDRLDAFHESYTKVAKDPLNVREILDKGAVLP